MKKSIWGLIFALVMFFAIDAWVTGGPAPEVYGIAIDPRDSNTLSASTEDGMFKTVDAGQTWFLANDGVVGSLYSDIAPHHQVFRLRPELLSAALRWNLCQNEPQL